MTRPGYWRYEETGVLRPVVEAYLKQEPLNREQIDIMRSYLRQWANGDWADCPEVKTLRISVNWLYTRESIETWIDYACDVGLDPL